MRRILALIGTIGPALILTAPAAMAQIAGPLTPVSPSAISRPGQKNLVPNMATDWQNPPGRSRQLDAIDAEAGVQRGGGDSGGGAGEGSGQGYSGGDLVISDDSGPRFSSRNLGDIPEYHQVRDGDTLWEICDHYYRDPWFWPRLWAKNPAITNPHWIYPGNRIRLVGGRAGAQGQQQPAGKQPMRLSGGVQGGSGEVRLRQIAFVEPEEVKASGRIVGSKVEHAMLSNDDEIYLRGGEKFKPRVGQTYTIYEMGNAVEDDGQVLGHIVNVLGEARVKRVNDKGTATATVSGAVKVIERGDVIGPVRRTFKRRSVRPADKTLDGRILANNTPTKFVGADGIVFLNRGKKHGVQVGNRFLVIRRGDGHRAIYQELERDNPNFPHETVAEIAVLDVRDRASVGVVTRLVKEVRLGDHVQMRRGY